MAAMLEAGVQAGHKHNPDHNGEEQWGISHIQFTIHKNRRHSTAAAFLHPVLDRPNLTAVTHALAHQLLIEKGRCIGGPLPERGTAQQRLHTG